MAAAVSPHVIPGMDDVPLGDDVPVVYDDMMRLTPAVTPIPGQEMDPPYRCPVSTPSNFVHPFQKARRTKPLQVNLEINLTARSNTGSKRSVGGKPPRTARDTNRTQSQLSTGRGGTGGGRRGGGGGGGGLESGKFGPPAGGRRGGMGGLTTTPIKAEQGTLNARSLDYYYVDKAEEKREAAEVNTFWLKALCSQPVTEILDKYRRRSDLRRTRYIWSKTYTTPGEKSLLSAWERNAPRAALQEIGSRYPAVTRGYATGAGGAGETQSLVPIQSGKGLGAGRGGGGTTGSMQGSFFRPYHSEPFNGDDITRAYTSDEGRDDDVDDYTDTDDDDITRAGASMTSGDVSVSTPRYSQRQLSPVQLQQQPQDTRGSAIQKEQQQQQQQGDSVENESAGTRGSLYNETTSSVQYQASLPAYDISDHFQVTLPNLMGAKTAKDRSGNKHRTAGGTHTSRDLKPEGILPPEVKKISRESQGNRNGVGSNSATQPASTTRSNAMETILPAIGRS